MSVVNDIKKKLDGFFNSLNNFGSSRNKVRNSIFVSGDLTSNNYGVLELLYEFSWAVKKAVNIIPEDALRDGIELNFENPEIKEKVKNKIAQIDLLSKIEYAQQMARLFGGSVIFIGALDGNEPEEPLDEENIKEIAFLKVYDRWRIQIDSINDDMKSPFFGEPEIYLIQPISLRSSNASFKVHRTRIIRFSGEVATEQKKLDNDGWDESIVVAIYDAVKNLGISDQHSGLIIQDFITKVLEMPGLAQLLGSDLGKKQLDKRMQLIVDRQTSDGVTIIEKDEKLTKIQTPVTGLSEIMEQVKESFCASIHVPKSRFYSQQLGQLSGATESTTQYNDYLQGYRNRKLKNPIQKVIDLTVVSKEISGNKKELSTFEFKPLFKITEKDMAEIRRIQSETDLNSTGGLGWLGIEEIRENRYNEDGTTNFKTIIDNEDFKTINEKEPDNDSSD